MFESNNYVKPNLAGIVLDQADQKASAMADAQQLFDTASLQGWAGRARALLLRNPNRLLDLNSVIGEGQIRARHYAGLRTVPIDQIRGSEGRTGRPPMAAKENAPLGGASRLLRPAFRSRRPVGVAPQRTPRPNTTTSKVWIRISTSNIRLWFFT